MIWFSLKRWYILTCFGNRNDELRSVYYPIQCTNACTFIYSQIPIFCWLLEVVHNYSKSRYSTLNFHAQDAVDAYDFWGCPFLSILYILTSLTARSFILEMLSAVCTFMYCNSIALHVPIPFGRSQDVPSFTGTPLDVNNYRTINHMQ